MKSSNDDSGILIAEDNKAIQDGDIAQDTRLKRWAVDVERDPPHLQVIERRGGTKWTLNTNNEYYIEEAIFTLKHGMPFPPAFLCFFRTIDGPDVSAIDAYTQDHAFMLYNAIGLGEEGLYAKVDDENFYIMHFVETFGFLGSGDHTFYGDDFLFRIRFELLNQPAFYLGHKGY